MPSGQAKLASELVLVRSYLVTDGIMIPMAGFPRFGRERYFLTSVFMLVAVSVL